MNQLAALIAALEGKRQSVSVAQVKEVLAIVADVVTADAETLRALLDYGIRRARPKTVPARKKKGK